MNAKKRKEIKRALTAIADGSEARLPLWVVIDRATIGWMRDAVAAIRHLEGRKRK